MAKRASPLCCLVVVMALYMAAGTRAQLTCSTNEKSALVEDAQRAFSKLRVESPFLICQRNCDEDRGCTVLGGFETAQLKMCGVCNACFSKPLLNPFFLPIIRDCGETTGDGETRVSGKFAPGDNFELVVEGQGESVDAGIEMKLRE